MSFLLTASQAVGISGLVSADIIFDEYFKERLSTGVYTLIWKARMVITGIMAGITLTAASGSIIPFATFTAVALTGAMLHSFYNSSKNMNKILTLGYAASFAVNTVATAILLYMSPSLYLLGSLAGHVLPPIVFISMFS